MSSNVWIVDGYQSDFARSLAKEKLEISDLTDEVVTGTVERAGIAWSDVESVHVANAFGELYVGQAHLGAMPATVAPSLVGLPSARHEAACASGSVAVLAAMAEIESGRYDCVLVVGVEQERCFPGPEAAEKQKAAAWVGHEAVEVPYTWPHMFDQVATEYDRRFGLDDEHLRAIAELNLRNARRNPLAQTRNWASTGSQSEDPLVAGCAWLRRSDCSQITDGGAGVVLVSDRFLARHEGHRRLARIAGWGHNTAPLSLQQKLALSQDDEFVFPWLRSTIEGAFHRGKVGGIEEIDVIETHDCFSSSEYAALDHFGITPPGQSWQAIESGDLEIGGRIPVNPSGGLIGGGHPVGASGVRMLLDAARQVSGNAGESQVEGASCAATLNFGGSLTTTVSFVVRNES